MKVYLPWSFVKTEAYEGKYDEVVDEYDEVDDDDKHDDEGSDDWNEVDV